MQGAGGQDGLGAVALSLQRGHRRDEVGVVPAILWRRKVWPSGS